MEIHLLTNAQGKILVSENLNSANFFLKRPKNSRFSLSDSASSNSLGGSDSEGGSRDLKPTL
jgi:hypothetical protein